MGRRAELGDNCLVAWPGPCTLFWLSSVCSRLFSNLEIASNLLHTGSNSPHFLLGKCPTWENRKELAWIPTSSFPPMLNGFCSAFVHSYFITFYKASFQECLLYLCALSHLLEGGSGEGIFQWEEGMSWGRDSLLVTITEASRNYTRTDRHKKARFKGLAGMRLLSRRNWSGHVLAVHHQFFFLWVKENSPYFFL